MTACSSASPASPKQLDAHGPADRMAPVARMPHTGKRSRLAKRTGAHCPGLKQTHSVVTTTDPSVGVPSPSLVSAASWLSPAPQIWIPARPSGSVTCQL